nr:hypothetical protein [Capnocytophaga canimorsus]
MTLKEFIEILEKPTKFKPSKCTNWKKFLLEYPYFQAARVLQLKIPYRTKLSLQ